MANYVILTLILLVLVCCKRASEGRSSLRDLPRFAREFRGETGKLPSEYYSDTDNSLYVIVDSCKLSEFKSIHRDLGRDEIVLHPEGLKRDFSFVPRPMYLPQGKNTFVFESGGFRHDERSQTTFYFIVSDGEVSGSDNEIKGRMIIHFR